MVENTEECGDGMGNNVGAENRRQNIKDKSTR